MWKLKRLYLKNFALIKSGLDKEEIEIDISEDESIFYLFVGKMGSGKSSILGHIQPFATYGTLDSRNQNSQIIEGKNGIKQISFIHGLDIYDIEHVYTWNKNGSTHNTKSYIKLNGEELNPNGNVSSFKDLIQLHFGIDQNYMRLLRLGSNVVNLVDLKSTERKNYISSRLYDAEIYNVLFKKLTDVYRQYNSKVSMLSNKLISLSSSKKEEMQEELELLNDKMGKLNIEVENIKTDIVKYSKENEILSKNKSIEDLINDKDNLESSIRDISINIDKIENTIQESSNANIDDINNKIGELRYRKSDMESRIFALKNEIRSIEDELTILKSKIKITDSEDQLNHLKARLDILEKEKLKYDKSLYKFNYNITWSYTKLTIFRDELYQYQYLLEELSQNDRKTIDYLYDTKSNITKVCKDKLNILNGRRVNLHKKLTNTEFSKTYVGMQTMYRAPFCPTKNCPYYQTHPLNIIDKEDKAKDVLESITNEIEVINKDIEYYNLLPIEYNKMINVKKIWKEYYPTLSSLDVLLVKDLKTILSDLFSRSNWYDKSKLDSIIERVKMKEDYSDLVSNINTIKAEIIEIEGLSSNKIKEEVLSKEKMLGDLYKSLEEYEIELKVISDDLTMQEELYQDCVDLDKNKKYLNQYRESLEIDNKNLIELTNSINKIIDNKDKSIRLKIELDKLTNDELSPTIKRIEDLRSILNDIEYTEDEFNNTIKTLDYLKDILSATSSKDGIPLVLIQLFLENCKSIVNTLIRGVFDDDLQILDFELNETDFKIPYIINGEIVDDIESASQGQKAIIEIALSFALITQLRESNNHSDTYNIMLLDEKDSSLYKKDRDKFAHIIFNQSRVINALQVFMITHNHNSFDGTKLSVIMTTEEVYDIGANNTYKLY